MLEKQVTKGLERQMSSGSSVKGGVNVNQLLQKSMPLNLDGVNDESALDPNPGSVGSLGKLNP